MLLDSYDLDFLKLCGIARYMPCKLAGKYNLQSFTKERAETLIDVNYIKEVKAERKCYRLTTRGRDLLRTLGYEFPDDARTHTKGSIFNRRVINADIDMIMHGAGMNIFAETMEGLDESDCTYIPSLTVRAATQSKVLAGTKFYGILRIGDTAYVIYYTDEKAGGIYPEYEHQIFTGLVSGMTSVRKLVIVMAGESVEGLVSTVFPDNQPKLQYGLVPFSKILERWSYDVCFLPMNTDGIMQLKLLGRQYIRDDVISRFADMEPPMKLNACDGVSDGMSYIVGLDMNISRVRKALNQSLRADVTPTIICLPYQRDMYKEMALKDKFPSTIKLRIINQDRFIEHFPELLQQFEPPQPVRHKDGTFVEI